VVLTVTSKVSTNLGHNVRVVGGGARSAGGRGLSLLPTYGLRCFVEGG
jgi:hypothetical protein